MAETKVVNIDPQTCHGHLYLVLVGWVPIGRASFQSKEERHFSKFNDVSKSMMPAPKPGYT